jgi:hypothetical protein
MNRPPSMPRIHWSFQKASVREGSLGGKAGAQRKDGSGNRIARSAAVTKKLQAILLDLVLKSPAADAKQGSRLCPVPVGLIEGIDDHLFLCQV